MNFSMSFSDAVDIGLIIIVLWLIVTEYISMYKSHQDAHKIIIGLSEDSVKINEQNILLKEQNKLLKEEVKILNKECAE